MNKRNLKFRYDAPIVEIGKMEESTPLCLSVFSGYFADDTGDSGKPGEGFFGNDEIDY